MSSEPYYQLVAIDIDGTLVDSDGKISPGAEQAIQLAYRQGIHISLVTGRGVPGALSLANRLKLDSPFIASGGAIIARPPVGEVIARMPLPMQQAAYLAHLGRSHRVMVFFETPEYLLSESIGLAFEENTRKFGYSLRIVEDLARDAPSCPAKITMVGDESALAQIEAVLSREKRPIHFSKTGSRYMFICRRWLIKDCSQLVWCTSSFGLLEESFNSHHTRQLGQQLDVFFGIRAAKSDQQVDRVIIWIPKIYRGIQLDSAECYPQSSFFRTGMGDGDAWGDDNIGAHFLGHLDHAFNVALFSRTAVHQQPTGRADGFLPVASFDASSNILGGNSRHKPNPQEDLRRAPP